MKKLVSQDCLDCIMEDVRDASLLGGGVMLHPEVVRRMIEEIIMNRPAGCEDAA